MRLVSSRTRKQRLAIAGVAVLGLGGLSVIQALPAAAATGCSVTYTVTSQWNTGFQGNIVIRNVGDAWTSWSLRFSFANGQTVTQGWNGRFSQSGSAVTVANESWNGSVANGGTVNPGFLGNWSGTNAAPTAFSVNGVACTGSPVTTSPTTGTPTTNPTTGTPTTAPPTTTPPTTNPTTGPPGQKVDNPYVGGRGYVNPEWKAKAETVTGGSRISSNPTAVWIDRIAAIEGTAGSQSNGPMGVEDHLLAAVAQGASYIQFVIYNLPGRDCAALASNGELGPTEIDRYKTAYIDPIAVYQNDARFRSLRIINIIEIDSLPNLITNVSGRPSATPTCDTMKANGNYQAGIAYALQKLGGIANVYNYIDAGHHGWIGWDTNLRPTAQLVADTVRLSGSVNNVHGFISNTANYAALTEPYITVNDTTRPSRWIDWNLYNDETTFVQAFRTEMIAQGMPAGIGMLIDTSRNGWGGTARPTGPVTTGTVDEQVNGSRIDRRIHKGNWCNQSGAGLGERPRSAPGAGIDAYVWVKPPGESDGSSQLIDNPDGKGFDRMCDPTYTGNVLNGNNLSGALPNAPISGAFFPAQLAQLMQNAYPAL
ncbi:glycoside hydrolase family 6 protein [Phytohabitans rumicis]|uniref:Glucanase n=1 Tax=Phytohabitans rumicis TaxID=1076125 RepID=A0A6V8LD70_9ACTN|nr:glycoside hydrolase family 6 protein [Phytohabitans rumicis]GFJ93600.1 glucanase [Phytohabitans rumicis]